MKPPTALTHLCAIAWVVLIGFAAAAAGAVHTRIFGHDIFVFLDAGWRVLNGQRPEVDFNPSMGALMAWFAAAGLKLSGNSVNGIGYMSGLIAFIAGAWAYALTRRMSGLASVLAAGVIALIAAAPFPIGCMPNMLSHAMVYNRYGYALLGLVVLECFLGTERGFAAGLSSGIVCVSLLFVKPSYCLAGVALVSGSFLIQKNSWRRTLGLAIGAAAAVVAIMALLHFDLGALWADLRLMGSARGAGLSLWNFRWAFLRGSGEFLPLAMLAVLVTAIRDEPRPLFVTCLLWGVGAALLASNAQAGGYPLNALLALILLEKGLSALSRNDIPAARFPAPQSILILLALTCYLPAALGNASGLAYAVADSRRTPASSVARFRQAPLAHLVFYDTPDGTDADLRSNGHIYVNYVNDGVDLIQRVSAADETVFVLDMVNPFCYALQRRPARGGSPALSFNHTFNDRSKPSAQWLFGAADIVMVPKHPASAEPDAAALFRNYLPAIEVQLRLCAESDWWKLYKRPDRLGGCPAANEPSRSTETAAQ